MGGLSRIAHRYFVDVHLPPTEEEEAIVQQLKDTEPYVSQHGTHCVVDGREIKVMSFKGTGVCSELCRKFRDKEIDEGKYREATDESIAQDAGIDRPSE